MTVLQAWTGRAYLLGCAQPSQGHVAICFLLFAGRTGQDIPDHVQERLSSHPNFLGIKECTGAVWQHWRA